MLGRVPRATDTARGWLRNGPAERVVHERGTPHAGPPPGPAPLPRAPPPPAARTACGIEESRARRAGPSGAERRGRDARLPRGRPRSAAARGAVSARGLEPVLRKTGPRTKRNPPCELVDRRRLLPLPLPRSRCHLRTPPRGAARRERRPGQGGPRSPPPATGRRAPSPLTCGAARRGGGGGGAAQHAAPRRGPPPQAGKPKRGPRAAASYKG